MFYEQNKIEPFLKCSKCYEKFDEPRVLPCGKTVCSLCLKTLITDKKKEGCFECCMCQASHNTNAEFPVNELVKGLMRTCEVLQSDLVKKFNFSTRCHHFFNFAIICFKYVVNKCAFVITIFFKPVRWLKNYID